MQRFFDRLALPPGDALGGGAEGPPRPGLSPHTGGSARQSSRCRQPEGSIAARNRQLFRSDGPILLAGVEPDGLNRWLSSLRMQLPRKRTSTADRPPSTDAKQSARETIDALPKDATWDDVMYRIYVRQRIEAGLHDAEAGNVVAVDEVRQRFGLAP